MSSHSLARCLAFAALGLSGATGCEDRRRAPPPSTDSSETREDAHGAARISLERGACYGACPIYKLSLHDDGRVEYEGSRFTGTCGHAEGRLEGEAFARLVKRFEAIQFWSLQDRYACGHDAPGIVLTSGSPGHEKRVDFDSLCDDPSGLMALAKAIDEAAGAERWVRGCGSKRPPELPALAFDEASAALRAEHDATLELAAQALRAAPAGVRVELASAASDAEKISVAVGRLAAVKAALVTRGIEAAQIDVASPTVAPTTGDGKTRVTLVIRANKCDCPGGSYGH